MDSAEAHRLLSSLGWLAKTPTHFRKSLLERSTFQRYGGGDALFNLGDPPGGIYGIATGAVEIEGPTPEGETNVLDIASSGRWLGCEAVFTGADRPFGVRAIMPTEVVHVPLASLEAIVAAKPEAWRFFGLLAIECADLASAAAFTLLIRDARKRGIAVLTRLYDSSTWGDLAISQERLACLANLSRTSVVSIVGELRNKGVVKSGYRALALGSAEGLKSMLAHGGPAGQS
jgi:CRP/FNR family cyclic AMP-dependent transcriptional regulator